MENESAASSDCQYEKNRVSKVKENYFCAMWYRFAGKVVANE